MQSPHSPLLDDGAAIEYFARYPDMTDPVRRAHAALTTQMDDVVRVVRRALEDATMWNDTVFVFASDNGGCAAPSLRVAPGCEGGASNLPLRGEKGTLWEVARAHARTRTRPCALTARHPTTPPLRIPR